MPQVSLQDTPLSGTSRSFTFQRSPRKPAECRSCGSSLGGRLKEKRHKTIGGVTYVVHRYVCGCGRGREVRRPADTGAAAG